MFLWRQLLLIDKKKSSRIIIPICIVLIVAWIWMVNNSDQKLEAPINEEDFALEAIGFYMFYLGF